MSDRLLEEGSDLRLDFTKVGKVAAGGEDVVPAVAQDVETGEVLIVGYANELALDTAVQTGKATFWSTSRNELWIKGQTSGNTLDIEEIRVNCEQNSILYRVRIRGAGACHTRTPEGDHRRGCYYRRLGPDGNLEHVE